ncbi:hypothetical protein BX666DRAFT_169913 [Dichotomocladium elegans]|nr:hypothetical protein BX666DRAFT_169913 [Dichotomocladium elegans]
MRLTVTTDTGDIYNLEIDSQMAIEDLKALLETESGIVPAEQELFHDGKPLDELKKLLEDYGVKQDDLVLLRRKQGNRVAAGDMARVVFSSFLAIQILI